MKRVAGAHRTAWFQPTCLPTQASQAVTGEGVESLAALDDFRNC